MSRKMWLWSNTTEYKPTLNYKKVLARLVGVKEVYRGPGIARLRLAWQKDHEADVLSVAICLQW